MADNNKVLENDPDLARGYEEYNDIEKEADDMAKQITKDLLEAIIKKDNNDKKLNLSTIIMAASKTLSYLSGYMYDDEKEFLDDVQLARQAVVADVIPALLHVHPCGECENCKNGEPEECINPKLTPEYTTSRILPIIANMLIEYDIFNKVLWINTSGKEAVEKLEKGEKDVSSISA